MVVEVVEPGLLTTVQDRGRWGYQKYGIPPAGAVDECALRLANCLLGNGDGEAALEVTLVGPVLRFRDAGWVAITGADLGARLNGLPVPLWETLPVRAGDVLSFEGGGRGMRAYVGFAGGLDVPAVLGSRSTYGRARLGGLEGRPLRKGDRLQARGGGCTRRRLSDRWIPDYGLDRVRVVLGPDLERFTETAVQAFLTGPYRVLPESDRMGLRLEGPRLEHRGTADIVSGPVCTGTVQVPGNGQPIVLLADRQTTGGYAQVATVISADLYRLGQARPGETVRFTACTLEEGQEARRELERRLAEVRRAVQRGELEVVHRWQVSVGESRHTVRVRHEPAGALAVEVGETRFRIEVVAVPRAEAEARAVAKRHALRAPMPGQVNAVLVSPGDRVQRGQRLAVLEALKMELDLVSPADGVVVEVKAAKGAAVQDGEEIVLIEEGP